jgi:hypothetical protein
LIGPEDEFGRCGFGWNSAAERYLAALLEETLVEKPGFPGFFFGPLLNFPYRG